MNTRQYGIIEEEYLTLRKFVKHEKYYDGSINRKHRIIQKQQGNNNKQNTERKNIFAKPLNENYEDELTKTFKEKMRINRLERRLQNMERLYQLIVKLEDEREETLQRIERE